MQSHQHALNEPLPEALNGPHRTRVLELVLHRSRARSVVDVAALNERRPAADRQLSRILVSDLPSPLMNFKTYFPTSLRCQTRGVQPDVAPLEQSPEQAAVVRAVERSQPVPVLQHYQRTPSLELPPESAFASSQLETSNSPSRRAPGVRPRTARRRARARRPRGATRCRRGQPVALLTCRGTKRRWKGARGRRRGRGRTARRRSGLSRARQGVGCPAATGEPPIQNKTEKTYVFAQDGRVVLERVREAEKECRARVAESALDELREQERARRLERVGDEHHQVSLRQRESVAARWGAAY